MGIGLVVRLGAVAVEKGLGRDTVFVLNGLEFGIADEE